MELTIKLEFIQIILDKLYCLSPIWHLESMTETINTHDSKKC